MPAYSHLLDEERDQIAVMRAAGRSICAIARALQRAKSTVSRELRRNGLSSGRYSPLHAAGAYQLRRRREAILEKDQKLRTFVCDRLAEGWTPEQISGWLKRETNAVCGRWVARRSTPSSTALTKRPNNFGVISRAVTNAGVRADRGPHEIRSKIGSPSMNGLKTIDARTEAGHWEGDLIICKRTRPVLVLHERKSRVTLAARLIGKTAAETISGRLLAVFRVICPHAAQVHHF